MNGTSRNVRGDEVGWEGMGEDVGWDVMGLETVWCGIQCDGK